MMIVLAHGQQKVDALRRRDEQRQALAGMREKRQQEIDQVKDDRRLEIETYRDQERRIKDQQRTAKMLAGDALLYMNI